MRTIRIYNPEPISTTQAFALADGPSHHLLRVLRLGEGAQLELFDGLGFSYQAKIIAIESKRAVVSVYSTLDRTVESPINTHIGLVMSKGDRFEWAVQKATELGVNAITPLDSERCEMRLKGNRAEKKQQQWQQIAISACEQCGRNNVPVIQPPMALNDWLAVDSELKLVLHPRDAQPLAQTASAPKSIALLIGPEGGLTDDEVSAAQSAGFASTLFGPRILRTETAPIVALSLVQSLWGDIDLA